MQIIGFLEKYPVLRMRFFVTCMGVGSMLLSHHVYIIRKRQALEFHLAINLMIWYT